MGTNQQLTDLRRWCRVAGFALVCALSFGLASGVNAQSGDDEEADDSADLGTMQVTGTRIPREGVDTFYPAISVDAQTLDDRAFTNVAQALNEISTFGAPDATPNGAQNAFSVGQNFVDFLGLGAQRTLTLVNGRRFVSSNTPSIFGETGGVQVDFNVIPLALVERIETISVGGAPIYGSDAIAGTINVILDDRYEGFEFNGQFSTSGDGDANSDLFSVVAGANFSDGRGNVTMSLEAYDQDGLPRNDRPRFTLNDPFYAEDNDGIFRIFRNQRINIFTDGGLISPGNVILPAQGVGALPDGTFYQFDTNSNLVPFTPGAAAPGSAFFALGGDGPDFFDNVAQIRSPLERQVFTARMNYDVSYSTRFSADLLFANTDATELVNQGGFQTFAFGGTSGAALIQADHPLLPQQARDVLSANGLDSFRLHRFNNDIIDSSNNREQFTWRASAGLDGEFTFAGRDFNWEVSAVHGRSDAKTEIEGIVDDRFINALDAVRLTAADLDGVSQNDILAITGTATAGVGDVVCRKVLQAARGELEGTSGSGLTDLDLPFVAGCVPLNIFGEGVRSSAARDWVTALQITEAEIQQTVLNANLGGELFELPAGAMAFNFGVETREEKADFIPALGNEIPLTRNSPFQRTGGQFDTDEVYAELAIPLFSPDMDIPGLEFAELNGAVREIDNSLAGDATVWTIGGRYAPIRDLYFRGNYTESLRAPSLVELFAPLTQVFDFANDPCDRRFVMEGPNAAARQANCMADFAGIGAAYDPTMFTSNIVNATAIGRSGGNPDLLNEEAESYAIGVTYEPRWVDNLVLTLDYVDIELTDAIQNLDLTSLMEACYDSNDFPNAGSCSSFTRDSAGQVVDFQTGQINAALFEYSSMDLAANYNFDVSSVAGWFSDSWGDRDLGRFMFRPRITYIDKRTISVNGEPESNTVGGFGDPEYSGTFDFAWQGDRSRLFWRIIWQEESLLDPEGDDVYHDENGNVITKTDDGRMIHNMSFSYVMPKLFEAAPEDVVLQLSVNNVFKHKPDLIEEARGYFGTAELLGRTYSLSVRARY